MSLVAGTLSGLSYATTGLGWAFLLLMLTGAVLAVREVGQILKRPHDLTAFRALAIALFSGYFLGPGLSIAAWYVGAGPDPVLLAGPFVYHGYSPPLSAAMALAYFSIAMLCVADYAGSRISVLHLERLVLAPIDMLFIVAMAALVLSALLAGDLGYMGTQVDANDTVSLLGSLGATVLPALVPIAFAAVLRQPASKAWRALSLLVLVSMCTVLVIQGRRVLIFAALTSIVFVRLYRPGQRTRNMVPRWRARQRSTLLITVATVFVLSGLYYFSALRVATERGGQDSALDARTVVAMQILRQDQHGFLGFASAQAGARSGTLPGYLAALLQYHPGGRLAGQCLASNIVTAIPRVLLAQKTYLTSKYSCTDNRVNAAYGLPQTDSPTTLLTQGYADFGWVGAVLYPLLVGALMQLTLRLGRAPGILSVKAFILSAVLFQSLFVEQSLASYLVAIRNLLIIMALGSIFWIIRTVAMKTEAIRR